MERFKELIRNSALEFPEADIQDRSKGDVLFKLIANPPNEWFITQCIVPGQQQLALTELGLVTLVLASLNAVTFAIWFHRPLGVQEPMKMYLKSEARNVVAAAQQVRTVDNLLKMI